MLKEQNFSVLVSTSQANKYTVKTPTFSVGFWGSGFFSVCLAWLRFVVLIGFVVILVLFVY